MGDIQSRRIIGSVVGPADTSLRGLTLPRGYLIAGVGVDNYSGSWLFIPQASVWVPPYTLGWAIGAYPLIAQVDVIYQTGPSESQSTSAGSPAIITLSSTPFAPNPGYPIIQVSPEVQFATSAYNFTVPTSGGQVSAAQVIDAPTSTQRVRLYNVSVGYWVLGIHDGANTDAGVIFNVIEDKANANLATLAISPGQPSDDIDFSQGVDLPLGAGLVVEGATAFGTVQVAIGATWAVI